MLPHPLPVARTPEDEDPDLSAGRASLPMTEDALIVRIERLESRLMDQEAALEEVTHTLLAQEALLREQGEMLKRMAEHLREALPPRLASAADETPPPHY
jgi:SlyX protein